jgi:Cu/Ag efflux protein CusF
MNAIRTGFLRAVYSDGLGLPLAIKLPQSNQESWTRPSTAKSRRSTRAGKITLKHSLAMGLGMDEGMTMIYRVKDPAMLKQVKVGDKVKFEAEEAASGYTVTKLQKSK